MPRNASQSELKSLRDYRDNIFRFTKGEIEWGDHSLVQTYGELTYTQIESMSHTGRTNRLEWLDMQLKGSLYCPHGPQAS